MKDEKKPFYKRWWFIAFAVVMVLGALGDLFGGDEEAEAEVEEPETEEVAEIEEEFEEEENEVEEIELPEEIDNLVVTPVRGDDSGNWKKVVSGTNLDMPKNAADYYNHYAEDGEVHFLINFTTNTTTTIRDSGSGYLYVDVAEYQDKEEHDAKKIARGELLKQYKVDKETGEVEELDFE